MTVEIPNFPGYYASSNGDITHIISNGRKTVLKPIKNKLRSNYLQIGLWKDRKKHTKKIHRIVAELFIPKVKGKNCINHIDGNKNNNFISNLEWCSYKENTKHAIDTGLIKNKGEDNSRHKLTWNQVDKIRSLDYNQYELARMFNVSQAEISLIKLNKVWKR